MNEIDTLYTAIPCQGDPLNNVAKGHIYLIRGPSHRLRGWMALKDAQKKFGERDISISKYTDSCSQCSKPLEERLNEIQRHSKIK